MEKNFYNLEYLPKMHRIGKVIGVLAVVASFMPALCLGVVYGLWPDWAALGTAALTAVSSFGVLWFVEPLSYYPVVGPMGTYMAFVSGNISNMRVPCASIATKSAGYTEGSDEGTITATIGIAVSTFVSTIFLTIGVIAGSWLLSILPPVVTQILNLLLPALFATLLVNYIWMRPKFGIMWTPVCFVMYWLYLQGVFGTGTLGTAFVPIFCAFGAMGLGVVGTNKGWW